MGRDDRDARVRAQYESYPYPPRDPADEATRLVVGSPGRLAELNHYVFAGARDFARPFRALVAGGGTGDAAIMLAQQLADEGPGEVVYLDVSEASAAVAKARAAARGLSNIRFVHGSLTALPALKLGRFDYIDCCGVLHHLEDPAAGLRMLAGALAEGGGMGLMVYAPLGRTGVYHMQSMLRMIGGDDALPDRVTQARTLLSRLPPTSWMRRNPYIGDHLLGGDAGLVDLLLHSRDRAFTVGEIDALVRGAGLALAAFVEPMRYDPLIQIGEGALAARLRAMRWIDRCAFAELLYGNHKTHVFYAVPAARAGRSVARADDPDAVPVPIGFDPAAMAARARDGGTLRAELDGLKLAFPLPPSAAPVLALMDGARSLGAIHEAVSRDAGAAQDWRGFIAGFGRLYAVLNGLNLLFLRKR
jgi:SAM-dependent methyltransferase